MINDDDVLDTEIDRAPIKSHRDIGSASSSEPRTAIDHDLAKRLLKAFPEKFTPPTGAQREPIPRPLPRTVLQAPLPNPLEDPSRNQNIFEAPASLTELPLAGFARAMRRLRSLAHGVRPSLRVLLAALLLAAAVGVGWWINGDQKSVDHSALNGPVRANKRAASSTPKFAKQPLKPSSINGIPTGPSANEQTVSNPNAVGETVAARAFIKGQRIEALSLYQRLYRQFPHRKVYGVVIEVLQRSLQHSCNNGQSAEGDPCITN